MPGSSWISGTSGRGFSAMRLVHSTAGRQLQPPRRFAMMALPHDPGSEFPVRDDLLDAHASIDWTVSQFESLADRINSWLQPKSMVAQAIRLVLGSRATEDDERQRE